jgi:hypothetical protein
MGIENQKGNQTIIIIFRNTKKILELVINNVLFSQLKLVQQFVINNCTNRFDVQKSFVAVHILFPE